MSGRKHVVQSYRMLDDVDATSSTNSNITNVENLDIASIYLSWTGGPVSGTLEVQARNGKNEDWRPLDFGAPITLSGASGTHDILIRELPFTDIRLVYTDGGSTSGTVEAVLTMKTIGA